MRVPYPILALEIEKLYLKEFPPNSDAAIEEHCVLIDEFICACGWSAEDYLQQFLEDVGLTGVEGALQFTDNRTSN